MKLTEEVLAVLSTAEVSGNEVRLTGQLDRKLYLKVNEVLTALGGKWNRKAKAHLFDDEPAERLDEAILSGSIDRGQDFGCFFTPAELAERVAEEAQLFPEATVLEPSVGNGALVKAMVALEPELFITCVEILERILLTVRPKDYPCRSMTLIRRDFLDNPFSKFDRTSFDRVVMNPPFSKQQDIDHVRRAYLFLKPEGRLVSIMSAGVLFRQNLNSVLFRSFVDDHDGTIEKLPSGSFKASGTNVETVLVTIPRGPNP